jgi:YVTN family beta-propeller protein
MQIRDLFAKAITTLLTNFLSEMIQVNSKQTAAIASMALLAMVALMAGFMSPAMALSTFEPKAFAFDKTHGNIYVANYGSNTVSVISGATNTVTKTITVGTHPTALTFDSKNDNIYVANFDSNTVSVISGATNTVTKTIPL